MSETKNLATAEQKSIMNPAQSPEPVFVNVQGHQESIPRIDSASLCSMAGRYDKYGCRIGPPGWESVPGILKRFTNTGSAGELTDCNVLFDLEGQIQTPTRCKYVKPQPVITVFYFLQFVFQFVEASIKVSFFEQRTPYKYTSWLHYILDSTPRIRMCAKSKNERST